MRRACYKSSLFSGCGIAIALWGQLTLVFANDVPVSWAAPPTTAAAPTTTDEPRVEDRTYSLPELLKLALSINPQTREVEEQAYQANLATRLAKSQYAPQLSIKALGGIQRTPLAIPPTDFTSRLAMVRDLLLSLIHI